MKTVGGRYSHIPERRALISSKTGKEMVKDALHSLHKRRLEIW